MGVLLYTAVVGLGVGVALAFLAGIGLWVTGVLLCIAVLLLTCFRRNPRTLIIVAFLAAAAFGIVRADFLLFQESQATLPTVIGQVAIVQGKIVDDPDQRDTNTHLAVAVSRINGTSGSGILLAQVSPDSAVSYGDTVEVRGFISAPQAFATNGGRQFNYPDYLRVRGIVAVMQKATLLSDTPSGASLRGVLFSLKHAFEASLQGLFPQPQGALLEGILLGERRGLPQDLTNAFIAASLIHIVVLSGYNVTIVAEAVLRALSFLPQALGYSLGTISMLLFAVMTGGGATTLRAVIMAVVAILARYLHRPSMALRSLALAALLLIVWNPLVLLYDTSFILSFLATFGLITISPRVEAHLTRLPLFRSGALPGIRSIAASTISVQVFVLPALLYFTGVLSLLALPANILVLPTVSPAMLFGFLAGVLGFVHPFLALIPTAAAEVLLQWILFIAQSVARIPLGSVIVPAFPAWVMIIAYIPLFCLALITYKKTP